MLTMLHIENFVLAKKISIDLNAGFTVFTGETGAGKTLIINAIRYGMGDQIHKETIASNERYPHVQMVFKAKESIKEFLSRYSIDDTDEIICERWINNAGKSKAKINGIFFSLPEYQKICKELVTIHGQNSTDDLFSRKKQLMLYDSLFKDTLQGHLDEIKEKRQDYLQLKKELLMLEESEKNREREMDFLAFQIEEIDKASLKIGEMELLKKERDLKSNSQKILSSLQFSIHLLESEDVSDQTSILLSLNKLTNALQNISIFTPFLQTSFQTARDCESILKDLARDLSNESRSIENQYDENALNEIINRIDAISHLQKKYGVSEQEILDFRMKAADRLEKLESIKETKEQTLSQLKETEQSLVESVLALSQKRLSHKQEFIDKIESELKDLSMENARFQIDFTFEADESPLGLSLENKKIRLYENGIDCIEFRIQTNPGQPDLPVTHIASGGELSRIMLAIKTIAGSIDQTPTLLFDEIDAGIGGNTGNKIGEKLKLLGKERQIICITHLPQIASKAEHHYCIEKKVDGDSTEISLQLLTREERIMEISRMLSGNKASDISLTHAKELIES